MATCFYIFCVLSVFTSTVFSGLIIPDPEYKHVYHAWPLLKGMAMDDVAAEILKEYPQLKIKVHHVSDGLVSEIQPNIVYLFEDDKGIVVNQPETVIKTAIRLTIWPEVVGKTAEEAKNIIQKESPNSEVEFVETKNHVMPDKNHYRVRVFVNGDNIVVEAPHNG